MNSRMEQIIEEIEEYIDSCKYATLSNKNIIVNKEELEELIEELRNKTPEEIKRYQKIISNKEEILADAHSRADQIISEAQVNANELVSDHEIMRAAYAQADQVVSLATQQAQEILDNAQNEANAVRTSAMTYADSLLADIQGILNNSIDTSRTRYESLIGNLQQYLDVVNANRSQLSGTEEPQKEEAGISVDIPAAVVPQTASDDSDFEDIDLGSSEE